MRMRVEPSRPDVVCAVRFLPFPSIHLANCLPFFSNSSAHAGRGFVNFFFLRLPIVQFPFRLAGFSSSPKYAARSSALCNSSVCSPRAKGIRDCLTIPVSRSISRNELPPLTASLRAVRSASVIVLFFGMRYCRRRLENVAPGGRKT